LINKFTTLIQRKSNEILMIYSDQDGMFKEESEIYSGARFASEEQQKRAVSKNDKFMIFVDRNLSFR
jgi:hypothetical protein